MSGSCENKRGFGRYGLEVSFTAMSVALFHGLCYVHVNVRITRLEDDGRYKSSLELKTQTTIIIAEPNSTFRIEISQFG